MKRMSLLAAGLCLGMLTGVLAAGDDHGFESGTPDLRSAGALAFGPDGILFIGDQKGAAVFAVSTGKDDDSRGGAINLEGFRSRVAATLGTTADDVLINDIAVKPGTRTVYVSVSRGTGPDAIPVILRVDSDGSISEFALTDVEFAKASLPNPPEDRPQGRRNRNPRTETITDLAYLDGQVYVAGLSNEEFASKLRSIDFPFAKVGNGTSIEIYHGAHGRYETNAPVRTFLPFNIGGDPHLLAAYTCTPLVIFPMDTLRSEAQVRGKTVAELGNRNRPLDMIAYEKGGESYLLIANSSRGIMKVPTSGITEVEGITSRIGGGGTAGLAYDTIDEMDGVVQLDKLDAAHAVVLMKSEKGSLDLRTVALP
jgi:hypothetical protein